MTVHIKIYDTLPEAKRALKKAAKEWASYTIGGESPEPIFWIGPAGSENDPCYVLNSSEPATNAQTWREWLTEQGV